jgi:hypothetical protein
MNMRYVDGVFDQERAAALSPWYHLAANGDGIVLTDPLTSEELPAGAVPPIVENEPLLHEGLEYLRRNGSMVNTTAVFAGHRSAEDLGDVQEGWFETHARQADFIGVEDLQYEPGRLERSLEAARRMVQNTSLPDGGWPAFLATYHEEYGARAETFLARRLFALVQSEAEHFQYDIPADCTAVEDAALQLIDSAATPGMPDRTAQYLAGTNVREWAWLARTGLELAQRTGPVLRRPIHYLMPAGGIHLDVPRKAQLLNVTVHPQYLLSADDPDLPVAVAMHKGLASRYLPASEMPAIDLYAAA